MMLFLLSALLLVCIVVLAALTLADGFWLERQFYRMNQPKWFWPLVFLVLLAALVLASSVAPRDF